MEKRRLQRWAGGATCALLLCLSACGPAQPLSPLPPMSPGDYQIGPEDTLDIIVWREEMLSGEVQVRPDGMVTLPLVGDMTAAGVTPETLAKQITLELGHFVDNPNVVVRVTQTGSRRFFVIGNVRAPGAYELSADQTLVQALAVAGGFTEFADSGDVRIMRQHGDTTHVRPDYDAIISGEAPDIRLQPNDTIVVP